MTLRLLTILTLVSITGCNIPGPLPSTTEEVELPICGDNIVDSNELCDEGTENNNEWGDCTEQCTFPTCGDALVHQPTEECDLGSANAPNAACRPDCTLTPTCGDGIVQPPESCDLGDENTDIPYGVPGCTNLCHPIPYCGDGSLDADYEVCDDGNEDNTDACTNTCEPNICGDGFLYVGYEDCDDANVDNQDNCLNTCEFASCGDGFIQSGVEECDGESDCGPGCYRDRYVFATANTFRGNFDEGIGDTGIERADWLCRAWAHAEQLHIDSDYRAWLSDDTSTPAERFFHSPGRYIFPDGTVFANSWDELIAGNITEPPDWTETMGKPMNGTIWSNTLANGTLATDTEHCNQWTSNNEGVGRIGGASLPNGQWSDYFTIPCDAENHLYCFEQ